MMANRLQNETSPYLLQHAHNPVNWYPWGKEALNIAKQEQKIILVSIGYSACHWCHVMERESFEDPRVATLMNSHFVCIKIDREERPDLDQIYMDAVQAISGSGGWPLNVFLTPDAKPFYGGTYFPPQRAFQRNSWTEVLQAMQQAWQQKPQEVLDQADYLTRHIGNTHFFSWGDATEKEQPEPTQLIAMAQAIMKSADRIWGGFGNAPKFPQTQVIQWLLRQYHYFTHENCPNDLPFAPAGLLQQALLSLDKMIAGGIYDQLQGGFARYSTDEKWLAPHFEKMLYDNALLISVLAEALQLTGKNIYRQAIVQTMDFIETEWLAPEGGLYSALDADSEGEEGKYYTWKKEEILEVLKDEEWCKWVADYYGVTKSGNWEGTNILWTPLELEAFCNHHRLPVEETSSKLEQARQLLLAKRSNRPKPLLDDKKLLSWNAMMVTAYTKAWAATGVEQYLQKAVRTVEYIESYLTNEQGGYYHNEKNGKAANPAFLDDLACYIEALCFLQEATGNELYLQRAAALVSYVIEHYSDDSSLYFYFTPGFQDDIIVRKVEVYDGATPSGNAIMARNLMYLGKLLDTRDWQDRANSMIASMLAAIVRHPGSFGYWAQLVQWQIYGLYELAIVGSKAQELSASVLQQYLPNKILQQARNTTTSSFPLLQGKEADANGETRIYPCFQFVCQAPVTNVASLMASLFSEKASIFSKK